MKTICVLGSTGSIGQNTLGIVRQYPDRFRLFALAAGKNIDLLFQQTVEFRPKLVSVQDARLASQLQTKLKSNPACRQTEVVYGNGGIKACIHVPEVDTVVVGIVGFAGLRPTLDAIQAGKRVALANKESLVVAGPLLQRELKQHPSVLIPVDSEHSALFQLLQTIPRSEIRTVVLTASGGPLFRHPEIQLEKVTPEFAVNHPNWKMGPKISVDSATLMNKALEVIEAHYLFDVPVAQIEVWIHPQSLVHGAVQFRDNSYMSQMNRPDMKLSIGFALNFPERLPDVIPKLGLSEMGRLEFYEPDAKRFPALNFARWAFERGHSHLIALNAANEIAVQAFLDRKIVFSQIPEILRRCMDKHAGVPISDLEEIEAADRDARVTAESFL